MILKHVFLAALAMGVPAALAGAETADAILSRMDASAPNFRSVEAAYRRVTHTAVIDDDSEESGTMRLVRNGGKTRVLVDLAKPDAKIYSVSENKFEVYFPKIKTVQEYDLGKQKDQVERFLSLGFGSAGKDLKKDYDIKVTGEDTIDGASATRLELTPKSTKFKDYFTKVELWVPAGASNAVREKVYQKSGDTLTAYYSNLKLNSGLGAASVELQLPPGVKREFPGK